MTIVIKKRDQVSTNKVQTQIIANSSKLVLSSVILVSEYICLKGSLIGMPLTGTAMTRKFVLQTVICSQAAASANCSK